MSQKYYDKILKGSGVQGKKFHSKFGASILEKFGWKDGQGLGKENDGIKDCIQIRRRDEKLGLGAGDPSNASANQWGNWWDTLYNTTAINVQLNSKRADQHNDSASSSAADSEASTASDSDTEPSLNKKKNVKAKQYQPVQLKASRQKGKLERIHRAERAKGLASISHETVKTGHGDAKKGKPKENDRKKKKKKKKQKSYATSE